MQIILILKFVKKKIECIKHRGNIMTGYWVETFIWDAEDEKWRFNGELYLDIRNIAWLIGMSRESRKDGEL